MIWSLVANKYHPIFYELWLLSNVQEIKIAKPPVTHLAECEQKAPMCVFRFENHPTVLVSHAMTSPFGQQTKQRNHPFPIRHASTHSLYVLLSADIQLYSYYTRPHKTFHD